MHRGVVGVVLALVDYCLSDSCESSCPASDCWAQCGPCCAVVVVAVVYWVVALSVAVLLVYLYNGIDGAVVPVHVTASAVAAAAAVPVAVVQHPCVVTIAVAAMVNGMHGLVGHIVQIVRQPIVLRNIPIRLSLLKQFIQSGHAHTHIFFWNFFFTHFMVSF